VFLIVLVLILIVLNFLNVFIYCCTRIPVCASVSASEPGCSIISVHFICLLIDFRINLCSLTNFNAKGSNLLTSLNAPKILFKFAVIGHKRSSANR